MERQVAPVVGVERRRRARPQTKTQRPPVERRAAPRDDVVQQEAPRVFVGRVRDETRLLVQLLDHLHHTKDRAVTAGLLAPAAVRAAHLQVQTPVLRREGA